MGFKKSDRVVCVNIKADFYNTRINLTYGKIYEVLEDSVMQRLSNFEIILIRNDYGFDEFYGAVKFVSMSEYRESIIDYIMA